MAHVKPTESMLKPLTSLQKVKLQIIEKLGHGLACANPRCPVPRKSLNIRALQLDHIHGNGDRDRARFARDGKVENVHFGFNNYAYFRWYSVHPGEARKTFQPLCAYCNWMKRYEKKHHKK